MTKHIMFALCAVLGLALTTFAASTAELTPAEKEAALLVRVASYAKGEATNPGIDFKACATNAALAAKVDDILATAKTPYALGTPFYATFPKTTAAFLKSIEAKYPLFVAIYRGEKDKPKAGEPGSLTFATESARAYQRKDAGFIVNYKKTIQRECVPAVRKYLRSQGKSFVTKDGVNPQQEYMDELTNILNGPRFAGLEAFLAKIGLNEKAGLDYFPDDAAIAAIKEDIFSGAKAFGPSAGTLLYVLGVEEYNRFVKQYNGED